MSSHRIQLVFVIKSYSITCLKENNKKKNSEQYIICNDFLPHKEMQQLRPWSCQRAVSINQRGTVVITMRLVARQEMSPVVLQTKTTTEK
jgi:hypothetical protein